MLLWAQCVPGAQVNLLVCADYGDKVLSCRIVYEWFEIFENSCTIVIDAERSGRPTINGLFSKRISSVERLSQVQLIVTCFIQN
jgi:hypothetical protein